MKPSPVLRRIRGELRATAHARQASLLQRFFKTGPGDYGAGDVFLGVRVPAIRKVAKLGDALELIEVRELLHSQFHEERLLALLILVRRFERGDSKLRQRLFCFYLREIRFVNNWDLVDLSAPNLVGAWLLGRDRKILDQLAASANLWERRVAVVATLAFIRQGEFTDTLRLCGGLLDDKHDLMHKACGWMLREVGKRNLEVLRAFLEAHAPRMPRTMLRYAIERMPAPERTDWLAVPREPATKLHRICDKVLSNQAPQTKGAHREPRTSS